MTDPKREFTTEEITQLAEEACQDAAKSVVEQARRTNTPVVVWRDGEIKYLYFDKHGNEIEGDHHTW